MKLSGYFKEKGNNVKLTSWEECNEYDYVLVSKVFTKTKIPEMILNKENLLFDPYPGTNFIFGGTGFDFNKNEFMPDEIEHHMPDYNLYDNFVFDKIKKGDKRVKWKYYLDYSIGYTTRFCFRRCPFCVNKDKTEVIKWSPVEEFYNEDKKYFSLWDDNILGSPNCIEIIKELQSYNKPFEFKQGMDIRLMTDKKAKLLSNSKYHGDYIFAFDDYNDREIIQKKIKLWNKYRGNKNTKLFLFCGFDRKERYDHSFWLKDIIELFDRIRILMEHNCIPYIMRHENYKNSPYKDIYTQIARWCNQTSFYKKKSFRDYCTMESNNESSERYMLEFEKKHPDIASKYYDIRLEDLKKY